MSCDTKDFFFGPTTTQSIRYGSYGSQMSCSSQNVLRVVVSEERKAGWRGGLYLGLGDVRDASCLALDPGLLSRGADILPAWLSNHGCDALQARALSSACA
jgi:hypothetical protein